MDKPVRKKTNRPPKGPALPAKDVSKSGRPPKGVTLKDIAGAVGVSMQTVSYALNDNGSVRPLLREKIKDAARQLGYRPNRSAKAMRTGKSNTIGLIVSDMSHPFYAELAQTLERAAASARYAVLLIDAQGEEVPSAETLERIEALPSHPVDGVISTVRVPAVLNLDLPVVFTGSRLPARDSAGSDDVLGQTELVEHLLALGHRRFGLVTSPTPGGVPVRRQVTIDLLSESGGLVWEYRTPPSEHVEEDFLDWVRRRDVTAIICSNDIVAISVQSAIRRAGMTVPDDVSVVGYDGIAWAAIVTPALTTMRMPLREMASAAIQLLGERLVEPERRARSRRFPAILINGQSTAAVSERGPTRK